MCFAQSKYRVCCFCPCYSQTVAVFHIFTDNEPVTVSFSAVSNGLLAAYTVKNKHVALIEDMKGNCLAYVACCSLELATESLKVYQQCKK